MLLLLAWMLWLYRYPDENDHDSAEEEREVETSIHSHHLKESVGEKQSGDEKNRIIEEEVFQAIDDVTQQSAYDNFDDWEFQSGVKEPRILKQPSIVGYHGNEASIINEPKVLAVEETFVKTELNTLASEPVNQRRLHSPNSSFTPVQRSKENLLSTGEGKERKTSTSSLNIVIHGDNVVAPNEVSVFEADLHHQYQLSPYHAEDEDSEVAQAFFNDNESNEEEEEDMQYTAQNGTKVTITHEAAGRIHSIRVKDKPPPKPTKIRIASPRMRATSPRVRAENISPTIISVEQEEMVHLVVNHHQMNVDTSSTEQPRKFKDPNFLNKQKKQLTDFDQIMNRRKKFVDTMDNAGRLLGQIAHRDEKISGGRRQLSPHWLKIKDAVRRRKYLQFKDKQMR